MKTPYALLTDFSQSISASWPAASAVVREIRANSGVTTPKLCGGGPKFGDFRRAKAGS